MTKTPIYDKLKELYRAANKAIKSALSQPNGEAGEKAYRNNIIDATLKFTGGSGVDRESMGSIVYRSISPFLDWIRDYHGNASLAFQDPDLPQKANSFVLGVTSDSYQIKGIQKEGIVKIDSKKLDAVIANETYSKIQGDLDAEDITKQVSPTEAYRNGENEAEQEEQTNEQETTPAETYNNAPEDVQEENETEQAEQTTEPLEEIVQNDEEDQEEQTETEYRRQAA